MLVTTGNTSAVAGYTPVWITKIPEKLHHRLDLHDTSFQSHKTHFSLQASLRSCPLPIIPLCLSREEGMIHLLPRENARASGEAARGLFSPFFTFLRCIYIFPPVYAFPCPHYLSLGLRGCTLDNTDTETFPLNKLSTIFHGLHSYRP